MVAKIMKMPEIWKKDRQGTLKTKKAILQDLKMLTACSPSRPEGFFSFFFNKLFECIKLRTAVRGHSY